MNQLRPSSDILTGVPLSNPVPLGSVQVTVNGTSYDITTATGTFSDEQSTAASQPWWGNSSLAGKLAAAVGSSLGLGNGFWEGFSTFVEVPVGPMFAYALDPHVADPDHLPNTPYTTGFDAQVYTPNGSLNSGVIGSLSELSEVDYNPYTFAVVVPSPIPAPGGARGGLPGSFPGPHSPTLI